MIRTAVKSIALAVLAGAFLLPLLWTLATSVKPLEEAYAFPPTLWPREWRWSNYAQVFEQLPFVRFVLNSLVITLGAVVGAVLTSSMAGYALARLAWRGKRLWFVLLLASMMLPAQVLLIPHFLIAGSLDWIGTYKPLIVPAWLGGGAFNVFVFRQYARMIPRELEESALLDGATRWQFYRHVLMPLARPIVVTVAFLSFVYHWQAFLNPLLYLSDFRTFTVSVGLRMFQTMAGTWINVLMAATVLAALPPLLLFAVLQRFLRRDEEVFAVAPARPLGV